MSGKIPKHMIDKIQDDNDIIEIIGGYVQLSKRGKNHWGLCPFHDERSPSFSVSEEKQLFHCFGCGKGGNVVSFIMEKETLNYIEAIHFLAERIDLTLPKSTAEKNISSEANQLLSAYEWLTKYYSHFLKYSDEAKEAKLYLEKRGINETTIERFQLGYAPSDSKLTIEFLKTKGFHEQFLIKSGLLMRRDDDTFIDPYRGRVIFPIKNHLGRTVAFGARGILNEHPKYLNSPEHELFQKGNLLFNYDLAKNFIRKENEVIIYEGYMDVLASDQANIKNILATLGTALSHHQAKTIRRYVDSVILCFDADDAGLKGAYDAAKQLTDVGCTVKIANIPHGFDADEYIKEYGGVKFKEHVINTSDTYFKFLMNYEKKNYNLSVESERISYIEEITKYLAQIESDIEREYYVNEIADEFALSESIIQKSIAHYRKSILKRQRMDKRSENSNTNHNLSYYRKEIIPKAFHTAETKLLSYMLNNNYIIDKVKEQIGTNFNMEEHRIILAHLYTVYEEHNEVTVTDLINKLDDERLIQMVTEIAFMPMNEDKSTEAIDDYIHTIKNETTEIAEIRALRQEQKRLEKENNPILAAEIGLKIIKIEKKLKNLQ